MTRVALLLAVLLPCVAQAQTPTALQKRAMQGGEGGSHIELTGFGGLALGNELYQAGGAELGLDDGSTFGGRAAFFPNPKLGIELSYAQTVASTWKPLRTQPTVMSSPGLSGSGSVILSPQ